MIKVLIPYQLQTLAGTGSELQLAVPLPCTTRELILALEAHHPALRGAILDYASGQRRPKIRFFACKEDISHDSLDTTLPDEVMAGREPFIILGAISGG
ncbi:MAG: MoaD/ThiS family protein [Gammaproteobacteria bacterium]|jgi:hypothetical protein